MKKGILASGLMMLMAIAIMIGSCKKDDDNNNNNNNNNGSTYYVKFKSNGTQVNFTGFGTEVAIFSHSGNQYTCAVTGADTSSNIGLSMYDTTAITTKTYSGFTTVNSLSATLGTLVTYGDGSGTSYNSNNTTFSITVTGLTDSTMTGTFSGSLQDNNGTNTLTITDGDFHVKRYQ